MNNNARKVALITGASAGIGMELAKLHASKNGDLVLVARREDKLLSLKSDLEERYNISVEIIAKDLAKKESPDEIFAEIINREISIDYLINNAGFSQQGYFHKNDWDKDEAMIMVHIMAMMRLIRLFLPVMVERNNGKILNVASSAAFAPGGPLQSVYFATKAFMVSFSQGLAGELVDTDVTVTALCPGATATEFEKVAGLDKTSLFELEKVFTAQEVAIDGYEAMLKGDLIKMSALTFGNKLVLKYMPLFPAKRVLEQIKKRQEKTK